MPDYRLCTAGVQLRDEINDRYSSRDKTSDGWIGDASHAARRSDHNPNSRGVVRAIDVDKDGFSAGAVVEHLRKMGKSGDRRLVGGYLIYRGRIAGTHTNWEWRKYNGANQHYAHFHVSFADASYNYEAKGSWGIAKVALAKKAGDRFLGLSNPPMSGQDVYNVQTVLLKLGNKIPHDGIYGQSTANLVGVFQRNRKIAERGVGPKTWAALRKEIHGG